MPKNIYGRTQGKNTTAVSVNDLFEPVSDIVIRLNSIIEQMLKMSSTPEGIDKNIIIQRINLLIEDLNTITRGV
jgi:hypothetical protein